MEAKQFFKSLYDSCNLPVAVCRGARAVYVSSDFLDLLERYHLRHVYDFLPSELAERIVSDSGEYAGVAFTKKIGRQEYYFHTVPYAFEGVDYAVITVREDVFRIDDEEQMFNLLKNVRIKLNQCLDSIYGRAELQGIQSEVYQDISLNVKRILRITDRLDYLGYQDREQVSVRVPLDLGVFVRNCVAAIHEVLPEASLDLGPCEEGTFVFVMPEELEQVLNTLVCNALRFCTSHVIVRSGVLEGHGVIEVVDDGAGHLSPARLGEWGYATPDRKGVCGLGMSLAVAKTLLERQNAALEYDRLGEQTVFRIVTELTEDPHLGRLAEWKPEDQRNNLTRLRVELSEYRS